MLHFSHDEFLTSRVILKKSIALYLLGPVTQEEVLYHKPEACWDLSICVPKPSRHIQYCLFCSLYHRERAFSFPSWQHCRVLVSGSFHELLHITIVIHFIKSLYNFDYLKKDGFKDRLMGEDVLINFLPVSVWIPYPLSVCVCHKNKKIIKGEKISKEKAKKEGKKYMW